jgi:DNA polymerase-3 subunit gamma/tau
MSYLVLARKYRPRRFGEMVGQEHVVQALGNALAQQRLHHAYLFTGTRGVGKTTVSRIFAKSVNCTGADGQGGITAEPCGVCEACRDIDAGRFVDYIELDAASNRGVDEISQLLDQSVYKPVVGRFKVYMIDEVHMLSTTAFNAMLKTLEEPPEYLKFVLATTDPQKVPPTVLSRCLQFNLRPMAPETVVEHLGTVLAAEQLVAEPGALRLLARAARGSMRDALSLTDQAIAYGGGSLAEAGVRQMLGAVDRSHAVGIVQALAASDGAALIAAVDALRAEGLAAAGLLEDLSLLAQQMAVLQAVPEAADADDPHTPALQALAALLPADETQLLYSLALHGRAELGLAPDEYSGLIMVLLRGLAFRPQGAPRTPGAPTKVSTAAASALSASPGQGGAVSRSLQRPAPVTKLATPVPRPTLGMREATPPAFAPARTVAPWDDAPGEAPPLEEAESASVTPPDAMEPLPVALRAIAPLLVASPAQANGPTDPANDRWVGLVTQLLARGSVTALVRELAWQAQCIAFDEQVDSQRWTLRVERESLRQASHIERLQGALAELLGVPVQLQVEAGAVTDSAARRDAAAKNRAQQQAEQIILNDPLVQSLLARYPGAAVVPGSIRPL